MTIRAFVEPTWKATSAGPTQEFQVSLETSLLEDIARIWNALNQPYQLSVSLEAAIVNIDSESHGIRIAPVQIGRADQRNHRRGEPRMTSRQTYHHFRPVLRHLARSLACAPAASPKRS